MRISGYYESPEFRQLWAKIMAEFPDAVLTDYTIKTRSRPRTSVPPPTPGQMAVTADKYAGILAAQRVANGIATNYDAEKASILADWTATPPDPSQIRDTKPRPSALKPPKTKKPKRAQKPRAETPTSALGWLQQAAAVLTERRIAKGEHLDYNAAYLASLNELKDGYFNPAHWRACDQIDQIHLKNVPTSGPDPLDRSYAYPDPARVRTLATYGAGEETTGPPRYSGNTLDGHFKDGLLVWSRTTFSLVNKIEPKQIEPTFIEVTGSIRAYANRRGSRPMLSWVSRTYLTGPDSGYLVTTVAPVMKPWSWYYRYKVPNTQAPFYNAVELKRAIRTMTQHKYMEPDTTLEKAVVMLAPRPMFGRGFNNNDSVTTQFNADIKIWQIDLNQPDPGVDHVHMYTLAGSCSFPQTLRQNGIFTEAQYTVTCSTNWAFGLTSMANDDGHIPADQKAAWAAAANAVVDGQAGYFLSHRDQVPRMCHDIVSPWMAPDAETRNEWLANNGIDCLSGVTHIAFLWFERGNTFTGLQIDAFTTGTLNNLGINMGILDALAAPGRQLFLRNELYQP